MSQKFPIIKNQLINHSSFAILGDMQRTMLYQVLMGKELNNDFERRQLIHEITQHEPNFLLLLGDMVSWGQSKREWKYFDQIMKPIRDKNIPLMSVVGNHDYFVFSKYATKNFQTRFPQLKKSPWYYLEYSVLGIIILDSNQSRLGQKKWQEQLIWLKETIKTLENNPLIKGIIFCSHHPVMTNSMEVAPHQPTNRDFVPLFLESKKTILYLNGHCHAYERFEKNNKTFIVSGGGGAPRQPLRTGFLSRCKDLYYGNMFRPFHYLWLTVNEDELVMEVKGIEKKQSQFQLLEKLTLKLF